MDSKEPSVKLNFAAKVMGVVSAVLGVPAFFLMADDLASQGEWLDGVVAAFAGSFLGACIACFVFAALSRTRKSRTWQTVWFVLSALTLAGLVACVVLMGLIFGSGG